MCRTLTENTNIPKIARSHVEQYVLYRQELTETKVPKAVEKGEKMVTSNMVLAVSSYLEESSASTSSDEDSPSVLYISGIVEAEMKSKTTYSLKIVIDGVTGEVWQGHCECPAGTGPTATCKHIVAVLLILVKFAQEGILQVKLSCTETLQTFKKPAKTHQGSPVRAEDLDKTIDWDHDPRPKKYRFSSKEVMYRIHNATTNFCAESGLDITFRYAFEKADVAQAEQDHDYLKKPLVEH